MAHRNTQRRILATPHPNLNPPSMDTTNQYLKPTPFNSTHPHHPTINPDLTPPSKPKPSFLGHHFSRLNLNHKGRSSQKPTANHPPPSPPSIDALLQAKAMTLSAIVEPSDLSLIQPKPKPQPSRASSVILENGFKPAKQSVKSKDHNKPLSKQSMGEQERMELHRLKQEVRKKDSKEGVYRRSLSHSQEAKTEELKYPLERHDLKRPSVSLALKGGVASGGGRRRRSFGGSQVELLDVFATCGVKVVSVDMPPFMQIHAVECARKAYDSMEKFTSKTLALSLKMEFDGAYGPAWHCIVGTSFGSFVTHSVGGFLYFSMDQKLHILLFKTTVQRAD